MRGEGSEEMGEWRVGNGKRIGEWRGVERWGGWEEKQRGRGLPRKREREQHRKYTQ